MTTKPNADTPEFVFHSKESAEAFAEPDDAYGIQYVRADSEELASAKRVFELMKKYPFLLTDGNDLDRQELEAAQEIDALLSAQSKVGEG